MLHCSWQLLVGVAVGGLALLAFVDLASKGGGDTRRSDDPAIASPTQPVTTFAQPTTTVRVALIERSSVLVDGVRSSFGVPEPHLSVRALAS